MNCVSTPLLVFCDVCCSRAESDSVSGIRVLNQVANILQDSDADEENSNDEDDQHSWVSIDEEEISYEEDCPILGHCEAHGLVQ